MSQQFHSLVETYEDLASALAQRHDSETTGDAIINESGQNSAIIIEQVYTCVWKVTVFTFSELSPLYKLVIGKNREVDK